MLVDKMVLKGQILSIQRRTAMLIVQISGPFLGYFYI